MRTLFLFLILTSVASAAEPRFYYSRETKIGNVTHGYSPSGRYTREDVGGGYTRYTVYPNPEPAWKSTRVAPAKITYGTRPRSNSRPAR